MEALWWELPWRWAALSDLPAGLTALTLAFRDTEGPPSGPLQLADLQQLAHLHLPDTRIDLDRRPHPPAKPVGRQLCVHGPQPRV
jgi:hypothetical protein